MSLDVEWVSFEEWEKSGVPDEDVDEHMDEVWEIIANAGVYSGAAHQAGHIPIFTAPDGRRFAMVCTMRAWGSIMQNVILEQTGVSIQPSSFYYHMPCGLPEGSSAQKVVDTILGWNGG